MRLIVQKTQQLHSSMKTTLQESPVGLLLTQIYRSGVGPAARPGSGSWRSWRMEAGCPARGPKRQRLPQTRASSWPGRRCCSARSGWAEGCSGCPGQSRDPHPLFSSVIARRDRRGSSTRLLRFVCVGRWRWCYQSIHRWRFVKWKYREQQKTFKTEFRD